MIISRIGMAVYACVVIFLSTNVNAQTPIEDPELGFQQYLEGLKSEAIERGYSQTLVSESFANIALRKRVITADKNQPERKITLTDYLQTRVPDWKVKQATDKLSLIHI